MVGAKSAIIGFLLSASVGAQTFYWNPGIAGGGEAQKSSNWTLFPNGNGIYAPSAKDDAFEDTTMGPWTWVDKVGDGFSSKSFTANSGRLTLAARGVDLWLNDIEIAAVYRTDIQGNFDVSVKVISQTNSDPWAKAGILVYNDFTNPAAGGAFAVVATPGNGWVEQYDRDLPQGFIDFPANWNDPPEVTYPHWLRMTRVGTVFTGWYRTDSTAAWTMIRQSRTPLAPGTNSQIGLFVTSHDTLETSTVVFDDFHGGGDISGTGVDLNFGGTGTLADNNAVLGANLAASSVNFTNYSGIFSFGGWTLSLTGNATFSSTMGINPNTGRLNLSGTSGVQTLTPKANDTLPALWKSGGSEVVVGGTNPLLADSLFISAGTFDLNSQNAHFQQLTSAGGTLEGLTAANDTLFIHGRADFSGLATLTPGLGTIAIKATGNGKTAAFDPGGKTFTHLTLWTVPTGTSDVFIPVGPGDLVVTGNLVFRHQRAPDGQDGNIEFHVHNPDVTVGGNISQVIEGTGTNWHPIRMGSGTWNVAGNMAFTLSGGSANASVLNLTGATGTTQTLAVTGGALAGVRHAAAGTVQQASALAAGSLDLIGGTWNANGQDLSLSGNLLVTGPAGTITGLGGSDLVILGDANFTGTAPSRLNLAPASDWTVNVTGSFTADHVDVANSKALGATGMAGANSADQGKNINWSFNGGPPTSIPVVTGTDPRDTTVMEGASASFTVAASGHSLSYQWRRAGDTAVIGTAATLAFPTVSLAQNGFLYRCIVVNTSGRDTTREARLTVTRRPVPASVTVEPLNVLVTAGQSASFSVTAAGDAPIAYAWRRRGDTAVLSTTSTLTRANPDTTLNGSYYHCIVSNPYGADTTREALLQVVPQPVPARITREPRDSTVYVTERVSFSVAAEGSDPLDFAWRKVGDTAVLSTQSVLAFASVTLAQDTSLYRCVVSNAYGKDTSVPARLRVLPPPVGPRIVRDPSDTLVKVGARVRFSAGVLGSAPLRYEWRRRGDTALLSTDSLFVIDSARESMNGYSYYVIVSNSTPDRDTSAEARLTVRLCDSLSIQIARDTAVEEGKNVAVWGKALCADRFEWSVVSGPAPRLLDPGVDTLAFRAPRVAGDTAIRYLFTAFFGAATQTREVRVGLKEAIPDPEMALPADLAWSGERPLVLKPSVFNQVQLNLFTGYPLRYVWYLEPLGADTAFAGDSLILRGPLADGVLSAILCMDNGGAADCDTVRVTVQSVPTTLDSNNRVAGIALPGGLRLQGSRLFWTAAGTVRLWDWRGRLLFEARGRSGSVGEVPPAVLRALYGRRARLTFRP